MHRLSPRWPPSICGRSRARRDTRRSAVSAVRHRDGQDSGPMAVHEIGDEVTKHGTRESVTPGNHPALKYPVRLGPLEIDGAAFLIGALYLGPARVSVPAPTLH